MGLETMHWKEVVGACHVGWVILLGSMGQRKGCRGAAHLYTSELKGNLSPETTFLSSPAIPLEVINFFQPMRVSRNRTVVELLQATYKLCFSTAQTVHRLVFPTTRDSPKGTRMLAGTLARGFQDPS